MNNLKTNKLQCEYQFQLQPLRFMLSKSSLTLCMSSISLAGASDCSSFCEICRDRVLKRKSYANSQSESLIVPELVENIAESLLSKQVANILNQNRMWKCCHVSLKWQNRFPFQNFCGFKMAENPVKLFCETATNARKRWAIITRESYLTEVAEHVFVEFTQSCRFIELILMFLMKSGN